MSHTPIFEELPPCPDCAKSGGRCYTCFIGVAPVIPTEVLPSLPTESPTMKVTKIQYIHEGLEIHSEDADPTKELLKVGDGVCTPELGYEGYVVKAVIIIGSTILVDLS